MSKPRILSICFAILGVSLFASCIKIGNKKISCTEKNTVKLPQNMLDFFYFKPGTWWVYQRDLDSGGYLLDSVWVESAAITADDPIKAKADCNCGNGLCFPQGEVRMRKQANVATGMPAFRGYWMDSYNLADKDELEKIRWYVGEGHYDDSKGALKCSSMTTKP